MATSLAMVPTACQRRALTASPTVAYASRTRTPWPQRVRQHAIRSSRENIASAARARTSPRATLIIRPDRYTLARLFQDNGYVTAAIGKWHLGLGNETGKQDWNKKLDLGLDAIGFDYSYIMAATADRVPCVYIENGEVVNYDASAPISVSYSKNFSGEPTGANNPELLTKLKSSHGHNQAIVNGIGRIGYMKGGGKALWRDEDIECQQTILHVSLHQRCPRATHAPRAFPWQESDGTAR